MNDFEGIRSQNPTKLLCFSPKYNVLVKILHWPAVPHMRNSSAPGRFGAIIQLQPLPWGDSKEIWGGHSREQPSGIE